MGKLKIKSINELEFLFSSSPDSNRLGESTEQVCVLLKVKSIFSEVCGARMPVVMF